MRALVTGGAGFIGSYLIPALLDKGLEVVVFDLADKPASLSEISKRITYVRGDLGSASDLYRVMLRYEISDVFHLGALLAGPCEEDPIRGFRVNFDSTRFLLDASLAVNVRRFVFLSSISVFGRDVPEPVTDGAVKNPETIYGQTKLASEHLLRWYADRRGIDTRAVRFTWVFGPGRTTGITALYSSLVLDAIAKGKAIEIPNPDERGDWLYAKDAVGAILALWAADNPGQRIFNISGGVHSIREVVEIARRFRPDAQVSYAEGGANLSPYPAAYDDGPARKLLGWKPAHTIESAVREHLRTVADGR
ncbi:MAG: NAD-dependent epimerase/dehydratase family protein [Desulfobacterales bacterium]